MDKVREIFAKIKDTSSTKEKMKIITDNKENPLFRKCLKFLLDGNILTGISSSKFKKISPTTSGLAAKQKLNTFEEVMDYLLINSTGKDEDIANVKSFVYDHYIVDDTEFDFYAQMITKKYRLGIDAKTVNKCIPGLIPSWDVQQAYPISDKNRPKDCEWFALSQKINGNNCGYFKGKLISRQGKEFTGLNHIIEDIHRLPHYEGLFFNGELVRKNTDNLSDNENFQLGTGIINSDDQDKSCIKFIIYEILTNEEFESGESILKYKQRREQHLNPLSVTISRLNLENIEVIPIIYEGTDKAKIEDLLEEANCNGWEGLMLNKDTVWKNKRNNGILKVKSFKTCDVFCTGVVEGDGKYKGTLGLIKCDYKGNELGVGTGFTDEQRHYFWQHADEIIGKICEVKYKGETQNKQGGLSVQFPVFVCVRNDKSEPSYN